jgi:hypothetical protein
MNEPDIVGMQRVLWGVALFALVALAAIFAFTPSQTKLKGLLQGKYPRIFRVLLPPGGDQFTMIAVGAMIQPGDFGWEAEPVKPDGLIYLHGLNDQWEVVWYAAFRSDQVEVVSEKPCTQYYRYPYWMAGSKKISACPYPVQKFGKRHFGFPVQIEGSWVQGQTVNRDNEWVKSTLVELDTPTNAVAVPMKLNAGTASRLRTLRDGSKAHLHQTEHPNTMPASSGKAEIGKAESRKGKVAWFRECVSPQHARFAFGQGCGCPSYVVTGISDVGCSVNKPEPCGNRYLQKPNSTSTVGFAGFGGSMNSLDPPAIGRNMRPWHLNPPMTNTQQL